MQGQPANSLEVVCSGATIRLVHAQTGCMLFYERGSVSLRRPAEPGSKSAPGEHWVVNCGAEGVPWRTSCANEVTLFPVRDPAICMSLREEPTPTLRTEPHAADNHIDASLEDLPANSLQRWFVATVCGRRPTG